ncbi:MAG: cysteine synthase A [Anaerolineaceae bacterium]|jgi:cysteine synthase A
MTIYQNMTELVGHTPLVRINRMNPNKEVEIAAKLEFFNPTHSVKDRIAVGMVNDAEAKGLLNPESILVEATSGNTGIGLANVAASRGYKSLILMPESASTERKLLMLALGAKLVLTPASEGMAAAVIKAMQLQQQDSRYWLADQFNNPANTETHRLTTGPEIWKETNGKVDILVAGVGTGGTITGAGEFLRTLNPALEVVAVEPSASPVLSGGKAGPHLLQGIGAGFVPSILNRELLNEIIQVTAEDAFNTAHQIATIEGIPGGISSGAAVWAALQVASRPQNNGKRIVVIVPSFAERYLSTPLFAEIRGKMNG